MTLTITIFAELKKCSIEEVNVEAEADNIDYVIQQETVDQGAKTMISGVWLEFRRMLLRESNCLIDNFVWCTHCKNPQPYYNNTTTKLWDHLRKCPKNSVAGSEAPSRIKFKLNELEGVYDAGAWFIVKGVLSFRAIEGEGLRKLIYAALQLGKKYPNMTEEDLKIALPSRNSVKTRVHRMAASGVSLLSRQIQQTITTTKRIAATADMWTDPQNSRPTLAVTLHFF